MYYKNEQERITSEAINDCAYKSVKRMRELLKPEETDNDKLYNSVVREMIQDRIQDLNYNDGTGRIYI